ncbi:MAG TPA: DUF1707 domain-containing protein [Gemmatimonadaceae bacterium]|nr:DUF1707 domain-containing protein [Gemmatimonadaceae bacterium]
MSSLEVDRERVIQQLCAHYANDHLSTEELEARFDRAYKATSASELAALVSNLPALAGAAVSVPARPAPPLPAATEGEVPREKRSLALMSELVRRGEWIPARRNVVRAIMASVTLDLREALLSSGEIEFDVKALMAEVTVIVPPGLRVSCDGLAILGEFQEYHSSGAGDPVAPLVRVHGTAVMATVTVEARFEGESAKDARRRRRLEGRRAG